MSASLRVNNGLSRQRQPAPLCRDPGSKVSNETFHSSSPSALIIKLNREYFKLRRELVNKKVCFVNAKKAMFGSSSHLAVGCGHLPFLISRFTTIYGRVSFASKS